MSSLPNFEYNPRREQLLAATEKLKSPKSEKKSCTIHVDQVQMKGQDVKMTKTQIELIQKVMNEQIVLSVDKDHHMKVEILGKNPKDLKFSVVIDGKSRFYITKHGVKEGSPVAVVQDRIKDKTIITSIKEFFQFISNLFYTPRYSSPELQDRTAKQAMKEDYTSLRKGLQEGRSWLKPKGKIKLSSSKRHERERMDKNINNAIDHAKQIEKALNSRDPSKEFNRLSNDLSMKIMYQLKEGESIIIPVGYLNSDRVMQPVMLRFEKDQNGKLFLEIYADAAEGKGKVPPLHKREFKGDVTGTEIKNVLDSAFQPMQNTSNHSSRLLKAAKPNTLFGELVHHELDPALQSAREQMVPKKEREKPESSVQQEPGERLASLTFEAFLIQIDSQMVDEENNPLWSEVEVEGQTAIDQPSSPSERIVGWFNHLIADSDNKFTDNEKLNLLFFLTEDYAQDQIRQLQIKGKNVSLEKQLEVYQKVADQIAHMKDNLAVSLNNGHALDTEGIPQSIRETEALCQNKIEKIRHKLHVRQLNLSSKELTKAQSSRLGFNVGAIAVPVPVSPAAVIGPAEQVAGMDEIQWRTNWLQGIQAVKNMFSPEKAAEQRNRQIAAEMYHFIDARVGKLDAEIRDLQRVGLKAKNYENLDPDKKIELLQHLTSSTSLLSQEDNESLKAALKLAEAPEANLDEILNEETVTVAVANAGNAANSNSLDLEETTRSLSEIKVDELVADGEIQLDKLDACIKAIVKTMSPDSLTTVKKDMGLNQEEFGVALRQLMLTPHQMPYIDSPKRGKNTFSNFDKLLLAIDPQQSHASPFNSIGEDIRVILNLRMLFPREALGNFIEQNWKENRERRIEDAIAFVDEAVQNAVSKLHEDRDRSQAEFNNLGLINRHIGTVSNEGAQPSQSIPEGATNRVMRKKLQVLTDVVTDNSGGELNAVLAGKIRELKVEREALRGVEGKEKEENILEAAIEELEAGYFQREVDHAKNRIEDLKTIVVGRNIMVYFAENIAAEKTLEDKKAKLDDLIKEFKTQLEQASGPDGEKEDAKIWNYVLNYLNPYIQPGTSANLSQIDTAIRTCEFLKRHVSLPNVKRYAVESVSHEIGIETLTKEEAPTRMSEANQDIVSTVIAMSQSLSELSQAAAAETDPINKKIMYEEIKIRSLQLLRELPPPGTDGALGTPSIWRSLTPRQSESMRSAIHDLQHHVWEAQMRLSITELSGTEKFMMIKAQAIHMALIRTEVSHQKELLEVALTDLWQRNPEALSAILKENGFEVESGNVVINLEALRPNPSNEIFRKLHSIAMNYRSASAALIRLKDTQSEGLSPQDKTLVESTLIGIIQSAQTESFGKEGDDIIWNAETGKLTINWDNADFNWDTVEKYIGEETSLYDDFSALNPMLLAFDTVTLDTMTINRVLSQDLTTCLSQDASLDREVQAVYHFVLADQSRGIDNKLHEEWQHFKDAGGRAPLMSRLWKHKPLAPIMNPFVVEAPPEKVIDSLPDTLDAGLKAFVHNVFRHKKPADENAIQEVMKKIKPSQDFESDSAAIKWNHQTQTLTIEWDNPLIEWEQLLDFVAETEPEVQTRLAMARAVEQNMQEESYYATAADPDFTLYDSYYECGKANPTGLTFFEKSPSLLLSQTTPIDLKPLRGSSGPLEVVTTGSSKPLAHVFLDGKGEEADWSDYGKQNSIDIPEENRELLMRRKKPFLPTLKLDPQSRGNFGFDVMGSPKPGLEDRRELYTYDVWKEYVMEIAGDQVLSIPPAVLLELYRIRQAPNDARNGYAITSYTSGTALNALDFMTDGKNQTYMQNDFVQKFIFESIFGPMVLQQAIIDHPEHLFSSLDQLMIVHELAKKSHNEELIGFYTTVLEKLGDHINQAKDQIRSQGLFAGSLRGLPVFRGKNMGKLYRSVQHGFDNIGMSSNAYLSDESLNSEEVNQPLAPVWIQLEICAEYISEILKEPKTSETSVRSILLDSKTDKRPIDKIKDPAAKRQAYIHLLQHYQSQAIKDLTTEDYIEIFKGYQLLLTASGEEGLPFLEKEIVNWVKRDFLPIIQDMDQGERDTMLREIVNARLVAEGENPISEQVEPFKPVNGKINRFVIQRGDSTRISIDLTTMEIFGVDLTTKSRSPVPIPMSIMKRSDVQKALKTNTLKAMSEKKGQVTHYTWSHDGQAFKMTVIGSNVSIQRTINNQPPLLDGTYTFRSVTQQDASNHAEKLLTDNGMWVMEGRKNEGWILCSGMNRAYTESIYKAVIDNSQNVQQVQTLSGSVVSTSNRLDGRSPVLFAHAEHTVVLLDAANLRPNALRIPQFGLAMNKSKDQWIIQQSGKKLGFLKKTDRAEEKLLTEKFGEHWFQFVIPIVNEEGKTDYMVIPYEQQVDRKGKMSVDQTSIENIPAPMMMSIGPDGRLKGSQASDLYLAHRFLMQAEKTRNPSAARKLMFKAQEHLDKISNQPPPTTPEEVENLAYVIQLIGEHPAIMLKPAPSQEGLALALKMGLFVHNIRQKAKSQGIIPLQTSTKKEMGEMSKIAKLYRAHKVLQKRAKAVSKLEQNLFTLSSDEKAALVNVNQRMLLNLDELIENATVETYFGETGRVVEKVTLPKPKEIDPQFLLALVRMAKPCDPEKSLKNITSPLPLDDLLENFWSYFISINNEGLKPEDLLFLFEESNLPLTSSPEEEQNLRNLDLQARQFLIAMADIMNQAGGNVDPMAKAKEGLEEAKKQVDGIIKEGTFQAFIGQFKGYPSISENFAKVKDGVDGLFIQPLPDTEPPLPDFNQLGRDLVTLVIHIGNFQEALEDALSDADKLIGEVKAQNKDLQEAVHVAEDALEKKQNQQKLELQVLESEYSQDNIDKLLSRLEAKAEAEIKSLEEEKRKIKSAAALEKEALEQEYEAKLEDVAEGEHQPILDEKAQKFAAIEENVEAQIAEIDQRLQAVKQKFEKDAAEVRERYTKDNFQKNKAIVEQKYAQEIEQLTFKKEDAQKALKAFLEEKVLDPVSGDELPRNEIIKGDYQDGIQLEELRGTIKKIKKMDKELKDQIDASTDLANKLQQWNQLKELLKDIEEVKVEPSSWFTLPDEGAAREFLKNLLIHNKETTFSQALSGFIKTGMQIGAVNATRLASAGHEIFKIQNRLGEIDSELQKQDGVNDGQLLPGLRGELLQERMQLKKKLQKNPMGNLMASAKALGPLLIVSEISGGDFECLPGTATEKTPSTEAYDVRKELRTHSSIHLLEQCFTPQQLQKMEENLSQLSDVEKKSYVEQLGEALGLHADLIESQTGLLDNLQSIRSQYDKRVHGQPKPVSSETHDFASIEGQSLADRYKEFYTAKAGFPDRSRLSEIFLLLGEKTKTNQPTLEYLHLITGHLVTCSSVDDHDKFMHWINAIRKDFDPLPNEFEPYLEALQLIGEAFQTKYNGQAFENEPIGQQSKKVTVLGQDVYVVAPQDSKGNVVFSLTQEFMSNLYTTKTGEELLLLIQDTYEKLAPIIADIDHKLFVDSLTSQTLPDESLYADDLRKGFESVERQNPLAFSTVISDHQVEEVQKAIDEDVSRLDKEIKSQKNEIVDRLEAVNLNQLPKSLQKIRLRRGSREELLEASLKAYRVGDFDSAVFKGETLKEGELSLDALIGKCLINRTRRQILQGARFNASKSAQKLVQLKEKKADVSERMRQAPAKKQELAAERDSLIDELSTVDDGIPDLPELNESKKAIVEAVIKQTVKPRDAAVAAGSVYDSELHYVYIERTEQPDLGGYRKISVDKNDITALMDKIAEEKDLKKAELDSQINALNRQIEGYDEQLNNELTALNSMWQRESDQISDFTDRCQSSSHITKLPPALKPYARHINFLQERRGLVLREDQIQTLVEIIENPALLKQLRMGLGKTSIILPFALMILGAKGHNTIGMVPKALFTTNFDEMDDTTRVVFELAGNQFLFNREDINFPINAASLHALSNKCANFFKALDRGEYILTTIESKSSLDNKISEIERNQVLIQAQIDRLNKEDEANKDEQIAPLFESLAKHQMALDMLYQVKSVFEADLTRLIIDEVDTVARANYSVNSESGVKAPISPEIQTIAVDIFDAIRGNDELKDIFEKIQDNNQFTIHEDEVNQAIKAIGNILLKDLPEINEKKADVLDWLAGLRSCPYDHSELRELGPVADKLKIMRKALNSALRSSLGLKAGLSCDFDPTHGAIGVPASQGVTSKTTKYSDPLMQVILTQMIALYKPQGEAFLKASAAEVILDMKHEVESIESTLKLLPELSPEIANLAAKRDELKKGIFKLSKLVNPTGYKADLERQLEEVQGQIDKKSTQELLDQKALLEKQIENLEAYIAKNNAASPPSFQQEIGSSDPLDIFLRQRFARQVAKRGLIYVSTSEMSRPVQHALRGCNVIGLTGTATRNTEHVVTSKGHSDALKGVTDAGRESTAEVIYRFVKAMTKRGESPKQTLDKPVRTYSLDTEKAFQQFIDFARTGSGYRFIVNQAGACDHLNLNEITTRLHEQCERPIIFLDMDADGKTEKVALINGAKRPLSSLSESEKEEVETHGFFYYHTPHVRGTHFDIPPGSKGALLLSPKVNANDRDQAIYRARALGEGHVVEPFISEKQREEFIDKTGKSEMSIGDMLKLQHEQTRTDEGQEDLSAYTLHIKGMVNSAADQAKEKLQLLKPTRFYGDWMNMSSRKAYLAEIAAKVKAFQVLEELFVKETGNEAYLAQLESEMRQGGTMETGDYLTSVVIRGERARIDRYLKNIEKIHADAEPEIQKALNIIVEELKSADMRLEQEAETIQAKWNTLKRQLPSETSSAPATQETAETEAEAEAEAVAETTSETESETNRRKRGLKTRDILTKPDFELLNSLQSKAHDITSSRDIHRSTRPEDDQGRRDLTLIKGWNRDVALTPRLNHMLGEAGLGTPPAVKVVVVEKEGHPLLVLTDAGDANELTANLGIFRKYLKDDQAGQGTITTGYSVTPVTGANGMIELKYGDSGTLSKSRREDFISSDSASLRGSIYVSLMMIGMTMISDNGWGDIESYWMTLETDERQDLQKALREKVSSGTLQKAALHLWDKPPEKVISLGGVKKPEVEKPSTKKNAIEGLKKHLEGLPTSMRQNASERWIQRNLEREMQDELYDLIEKVDNWNVDLENLFKEDNLKL